MKHKTGTSLNRLSIIWVIATLFVSMLPQLKSMPLHLVPITLLPIAWRLMAEFKHWKPISMTLRVMATLMALAALLTTYGGLMGRRAAVSMLVLMLSLKLLETFRTRDARIVTSLSLFLCGTQFLFSQGIPMILYIAACILSALITLMLLQRREAWEKLGEAPVNNKIFTEVGFGLRLLALALPVGIALFLFFPRWSSPLWGIPEDALDARSGLSDSMSPGSIQSLFMDDSPAFRATFEGQLPRNDQMYWRGPVFWQFDGQSWSAGYYSQNLPATSKADPTTAPFRYRVQMEPTEQRWLFALDYPALQPRRAKLTMDYQLRARRPVTELYEYIMASDPDFVDTPVLKNTMKRKALELPVGFNPKTAAMMAQWREETSSVNGLVQRVLTYFNEEQFHYTLNPALLSRHTVDEFLFDTREGFCEHYASAFTVMMRMAGVPARVVTGYQGGWFNNIGSYVLVRQSDAHAWSEVWAEGVGWVRVDPTAAVAPSRVERGAMDTLGERRHVLDFDWLRSVRNGFDLFQRGWNNWVVAFSANKQSRLFSIFGWEAMDSTKLVVLMIGSILLITVTIFFLTPLLFKYHSGRKQDPLFYLWHRFTRKLSKAGLTVVPSMGPMELANEAGKQFQNQSDVIMRIAELYMLCRYSRHVGSQAELERLIRTFRPQASAGKALATDAKVQT